MLFLRTETKEMLIQMLGTVLTLAVLLNSTEPCTNKVKNKAVDVYNIYAYSWTGSIALFILIIDTRWSWVLLCQF